MKIQFIVFLVIGLISLIRTMNQAKKPNPNQAGVPGPRRNVKSEIEAFLSEVRSASGTDASPEQQAERKRAQQSRRQQARKASRTQPNANPVPPPRPRRAMGSGIGDHVDSYISSHVQEYVDSKVDDLVEVDIVRNVDSHLGSRSTELPAETRRSTAKPAAALRFRELLRSREGVRQAILLNEILTRPSALRR